MIFKLNNKVSRKSAKICPELIKTSKRRDRHCCGIPVVKHLCAEFSFHSYLKMLGEEKRSITNVNLKNYPRQIQHPVTDRKMELLAKIVNHFKQQTISAKKHHFRCVTDSEFASNYHKSNVSYEQQKSYITVFWNGGSYYLAEILLVQSQQ